MSEKTHAPQHPSEIDPRRKPCVTIEFSRYNREYVLVLRPGGIYADAVNIPGNWERILQERLGEKWKVMDRGTRFEIKPPPIDKGGFSEYIRTPETDRTVADALKSVLDETVELKFSR